MIWGAQDMALPGDAAVTHHPRMAVGPHGAGRGPGRGDGGMAGVENSRLLQETSPQPLSGGAETWALLPMSGQVVLGAAGQAGTLS